MSSEVIAIISEAITLRDYHYAECEKSEIPSEVENVTEINGELVVELVNGKKYKVTVEEM